MSSLRILFPLLTLSFAVPLVRGQSPSQGTLLILEDFSSGTVDRAKFSNAEWNVPDTWELREGALASIYDAQKHPGKAHGRSVDPKFKAHNVRVGYRVKFEGEAARLSMIINAGFPPVKTGLPVWHIGDVNSRLPRNASDTCISIGERDFTYDENDPRNVRKSHGPADIFKPLGAFEIPGINTRGSAPLEPGKWHQFVVENIGTRWTLWVDGRESLSLTLKHSDIEKASINFIAFGPLLLDDIRIEELPR
jgi:hypothetical protein